MSHIGLSLDPETNDLHFDQVGHLVLARDAHAVGQHIRQRLKAFEGEWFLDGTAGVPWLDEIMGKQYNPALAEAIVKAEILDTPEVVEITNFSVSFDRSIRRLNIRDVEVLTTYDQEVRI